MPKKFVREARRASGGTSFSISSFLNMGQDDPPTDPNLVSGQVEVGAGTQFEIPVLAYEGCILTWCFQTQGGDIGFGVSFKADEFPKAAAEADDDSTREHVSAQTLKPGDEVILSESRRYSSQDVHVQGTVQIARSGTITLKWDNSYSFFKGKMLSYTIELEEPLGLQGGPRALGGPDCPRVIFVLGGPGAGKGTQGEKLAGFSGFLHVSAGDLLRKERNNSSSQHGQLITDCIKEGKIVPVAITVALLWKAIRQSGRRFILVDGFPRNRDNLEGWQRKIGGRAQIVACVSVEVPDDVLIRRLLERSNHSGRDDDNPDSIRKRLVIFHEETRPILDYFEKRGELLKVNGNGSREEVLEDLCVTLKSKMASNLPSKDDFVLAAPRNRFAPRVILGAARIGGDGMNETEAKDYIKEFSAFEPGCNEIDSARVYSHGETEKTLGRIVVSGKSRISSKVDPFPGFGEDLSPNSVAAQVGEALAALKSDSLDILYLHAPDASIPIEQTLEACDALYRKGKFRELGLASFPAWQVVNAYHICASRGWVKPTVYQGAYNVVCRGVETELFPAIRALGIRFYASSPLAGGLLARDLLSIPEKSERTRSQSSALHFRGRFFGMSYAEVVTSIEETAKPFGLTLQEVSLRWLAHHSFLHTALDDGIVLTASTANQLKQDLHLVREGGPLPLPLVVSLDASWEECKAHSPSYFQE